MNTGKKNRITMQHARDQAVKQCKSQYGDYIGRLESENMELRAVSARLQEENRRLKTQLQAMADQLNGTPAFMKNPVIKQAFAMLDTAGYGLSAETGTETNNRQED